MTDPPHQRRPRYRGTHPQRFREKYKELAPERYPEIVTHLRERGHTPAGQHVPILVEEVLEALAVRPGQRGVDATLGWGGHAGRLLERITPGGRLLALDADPIELPKTEARLRGRGFGDDVLIVSRTNFAAVRAAIAVVDWTDGVDFLLADLGVSSMQVDDPARGFSLKADGPLDMRMNPNRGRSAADWLVHASIRTLGSVLRDHADEPFADAVADAIVARQARDGPFTTTRALADVVRGTVEAGGGDAASSVRRVFQAIRIEVNDEFGALDALLRQLPACLRPAGRAAILTFHSGEDRRVKKAFDQGARAGLYLAMREIIRPSPDERRANTRAGAAKLRVVERTA